MIVGLSIREGAEGGNVLMSAIYYEMDPKKIKWIDR